VRPSGQVELGERLAEGDGTTPAGVLEGGSLSARRPALTAERMLAAAVEQLGER